MSKHKHNIDGYTAQDAADMVGVSVGRIHQLVDPKQTAEPIDHKKFGRLLVITPKGIEQARNRNTKVGRPVTNGRKTKKQV